MLNTYRVVISLLSLMVMLAVSPTSVQAQFTNFQFGNRVGGVKVNPNGVLDQATREDVHMSEMTGTLNGAKLSDSADYRKLSLRVLNQIVKDSVQNNSPIPVEARHLAGLMRIERVVIDREHNDLILMGPAEALVVNQAGDVVGAKSGMPALQLEDLMTALQTVEAATTGQGVSVSIEPSNEGRLAFKRVTAAAQRSGASAQAVVSSLESEMGNQNVILTGIPTDTRFANVLALADYKMKRISMGLDQSPLKSLPSFLSMLTKSTNLSALTPRFWMEMDYQPVTHNTDKTVWQLNGVGVKTLTETDVMNANGSTVGTGRANPLAAKWAETMTKNYEALMQVEPIFGELRNVFDLAVMAALIDKEQMLTKAGLELDGLTKSYEALHQWNAPNSVPTTASVVAARRGNVVAASGGVQLDPWTVVSNVKVDDKLSVVFNEVKGTDGTALFWD